MLTEIEKPPVLLWNNKYKHSIKVFTEEEIKLIFNTLRNNKEDYHNNQLGNFQRSRDLCIIAFAYYEAMRIGEIVKLRFDDIDFKNKKIYINGKNNHVKKDSILYLCKQMIPFLEEYLSFSKRYWKNSPYLFPSNQNEHISTCRFKHIIREKVLKKCGLWTLKTRTYSLRKSRLTHLLNQGKDIYLVSNVARHNSIETTKQYYIAHSEDYNKYIEAVMDNELEAYKKPDIQINNNFNINLIFQQIFIQLEKQNEMILKIMEKMKE